MKKLKKEEIRWLLSVLFFYLLYNLPFVPPYGHPVAAIVHGVLTLVPLWISVYLGFFQICRLFRLKRDKKC